MYIKHKDMKKAKQLYDLLIRRITQSAVKGISISLNIWKELNVIQKKIN